VVFNGSLICIMSEGPNSRFKSTMGSFIFLSRWLQAPLCFGLIVAQGVYVYHFMVELWHLLQKTTTITETDIMLVVLGLIDVVMIANLLLLGTAFYSVQVSSIKSMRSIGSGVGDRHFSAGAQHIGYRIPMKKITGRFNRE
jgi:uncharacterized membrane protein YqhA